MSSFLWDNLIQMMLHFCRLLLFCRTIADQKKPLINPTAAGRKNNYLRNTKAGTLDSGIPASARYLLLCLYCLTGFSFGPARELDKYFNKPPEADGRYDIVHQGQISQYY